MHNVDRAFALIARINDSATPARTAQRASAKVARLASAAECPRLFWLSNALRAHSHSLANAGINSREVAYQTEKRDRCVKLYAHGWVR